MGDFLREHLTKIFGTIVAVLGTLQTLVSTGGFEGLMEPSSIRWLNIWIALLTTLFGGATIARGFNNTTKERVSEAMIEALHTPAPPPATKQTGMARSLMLCVMLAVAAPTFVAVSSLSGCSTLSQMSFDQRLQLSIDTATATTNAVSAALDSGLVTKKQATQYLELVKQARALFDLAIELKDSDTQTAQGQLRLAEEILKQLQKLLAEESA